MGLPIGRYHRKKKTPENAPEKNTQSKHRNKKTEVDGIKFDSKLEARRYIELKSLSETGHISDLQCQVRFNLIPAQRINNRVVERACDYLADFVYIENGRQIVEDVKSPITKTPAYIIKRKLMLERHNIRIREYMEKKKAGQYRPVVY